VDSPDWRPVARMETLRARAALMAAVRDFFAQRGVLEVETPLCSRYATTDPALDPFVTRYAGPHAPPQGTLYLQTSPEFPMKRLLAAGSGPIYQICKAFRNGEYGRRHNPEFTLLEWYRPGFDHRRLMGEVAELVQTALGAAMPVERWTYADLFHHHLGIDAFHAPSDALAMRAREFGVDTEGMAGASRNAWLDLLLSHVIEPRLPPDRLIFIHDYPASQAALARIRPDDPPVAERFELYVGPMELANGFNELLDPQEQRRRFRAEQRACTMAGTPERPLDERLLQALAAGMPATAGVALGLDRLLMLKVGARDIREVLAFPLERA